MRPRAKGRPGTTAEPAAAGPHGGQASIRQAYEALGVEHFYASHGYHYTNPHESQISAAISQLLDEVPPSVWLGMEDLAPDTAADGSDSDADEDDPGPESHGASSIVCGLAPTSTAGQLHAPQIPDESSSRQVAGTASGTTAAPDLNQSGRFSQSNKAVTSAVDVADAVESGPAAAAAAAVTSTACDGPSGTPMLLPPPVTFRVLDLACGSGEASAAITDWNVRHIVEGEGPLGPGPLSGAVQRQPQQHQHPQQQQRRQPGGKQATGVLMPYELRITACDPYTGDAYLRRTGRVALRWSFEDIADGCLADWAPDSEGPPPPLAAPALGPPLAAPKALPTHSHQRKHGQKQLQQQQQQQAQQLQQQRGRRAGAATALESASASQVTTATAAARVPSGPHFDLVVCSFALHLCDPTRMYGTCTALSVAARWLAVLAPHKRPQLGPELGWELMRERRVERTHLRLYRSLRVPGAA